MPDIVIEEIPPANAPTGSLRRFFRIAVRFTVYSAVCVFALATFVTYQVADMDDIDAPLIIENTSEFNLESVVLVSDRGVVRLGNVNAHSKLTNPLPAGLGEIDYHFIYTRSGQRMISRHLYRGDRPFDQRLYHRIDWTNDDQIRWVTIQNWGEDGSNLEGEQTFQYKPDLGCCVPAMPKSERTVHGAESL